MIKRFIVFRVSLYRKTIVNFIEEKYFAFQHLFRILHILVKKQTF